MRLLWLRRLLPTPINIAWSLLFAVLVWLIADSNVRQSRPLVPARLSIEVPAGYVYKFVGSGSREPPAASVTIYGPREAFVRLPDALQATYRWAPQGNEEVTTISIGPRDWRIDLSSPELAEDLTTFEPRRVDVVISKVAMRELRVQHQLGPVPQGWEVPADLVRVEPNFVEAVGPERDLEQNPILFTEAIELERRLQQLGWRPQMARPYTFTVERARLVPPANTAIEPVDPDVRVMLTVQPEPVTVTLRDVEPAIAVEPFFDLERYRIETKQGLNLVKLELRGPKVVMADERALRDQVKVYAVLTRRSHDQRPVTPGRLRPLEIVVYPPPGVEWLNRAEDFRFQVTVEEVKRPGG